MHLVVLSRDKGYLGQFSVRRSWLGALTVVLAIFAGIFLAGYRAAGAGGTEAQLAAWQADLERQEELLTATREDLQQNLDALALRMGQMNAHVVRLDALGSRLTQLAGFSDGEFDFTMPPPRGGPEELIHDSAGNEIAGLVDALDLLDIQIADRSRQLGVLEDLLLNRRLADEIHPEGRPVNSGYISSTYGERNDPITGRVAFHKGVDFAGREGNDIIAVASGIVTWAGDRYGYGEMVELNHGNGYVTRYAHNAENLVNVGDTVKRGDLIARMGETGRATGPNLHFEVLRDGRTVNPLSVIN